MPPHRDLGAEGQQDLTLCDAPLLVPAPRQFLCGFEHPPLLRGLWRQSTDGSKFAQHLRPMAQETGDALNNNPLQRSGRHPQRIGMFLPRPGQQAIPDGVAIPAPGLVRMGGDHRFAARAGHPRQTTSMRIPPRWLLLCSTTSPGCMKARLASARRKKSSMT